jgi:type I restriction enzyme S subunit
MLPGMVQAVELNRKQDRTLEAIAQALFKRWFVEFEFPDENGQPYKSNGGAMQPSELGEIPVGWEVKPLDQIAEYLNGLALQKFPPEGDEHLPVIKIREMKQGVTANSDKASSKLDPKYIIDDGDVLFSWSGSLEVDIWCHGKGALNQHLFKVTSGDYPKWFYYLWTKYHLRAFQAVAADKATTMGHIQRAHLSEALTVCPPDDSIPEINEIFEPLIGKIISDRIDSRTLAKVRDTLLPKLMSGELRILDRMSAEQKTTKLEQPGATHAQ